MTSTLPPLVQAFSGSIGSATANAAVYPLDLVATRLQTTSSRKLRGFHGILAVLRHVVRTEGWSGLYDGLGTDTAATLLSNFLYYYFYTLLRALVLRRKRHLGQSHSKTMPALLSVPAELAIGFVAGVASRAISTPLSVITVRLQTETEGEDDEGELNAEKGGPEEAQRKNAPSGVVGTVQRIYDDHGLRGSGEVRFTTTVPLCLTPAITLFLIQLFRRLTTPRSATAGATTKPPDARVAFLSAALSNAAATAMMYPLMLAKTRLQVHRKRARGNEEAEESQTMTSVWREAIRKEGMRGLYQGLQAQLTKGFVSEGVTMVMKQRVEVYVVALHLKSMAVRRR